MPNTNCLAGMQCPDCSSEGPLNIMATLWVQVDDNGTDWAPSGMGDVEWEDANPCQCQQCGLTGTVADFRTGGAA